MGEAPGTSAAGSEDHPVSGQRCGEAVGSVRWTLPHHVRTAGAPAGITCMVLVFLVLEIEHGAAIEPHAQPLRVFDTGCFVLSLRWGSTVLFSLASGITDVYHLTRPVIL